MHLAVKIKTVWGQILGTAKCAYIQSMRDTSVLSLMEGLHGAPVKRVCKTTRCLNPAHYVLKDTPQYLIPPPDLEELIEYIRAERPQLEETFREFPHLPKEEVTRIYGEVTCGL